MNSGCSWVLAFVENLAHASKWVLPESLLLSLNLHHYYSALSLGKGEENLSNDNKCSTSYHLGKNWV